MFFTKENIRYIILCIIIIVVGLVFVYRLMQIQIVHGEEYEQKSVRKVLNSINVKAERGAILDRYGKPLVNNRSGYTVQIVKANRDDAAINQLILDLIKLIDRNKLPVEDNLPITKEYPFKFSIDKKGELKWKEKREIPKNLDANETLEVLCERYKISEKFTDYEKRKVVGIREEMNRKGFNETNPFTIATDVNVELAMKIVESHLKYPGVNIKIEPIRNFAAGSMASHILGRVGIIFAEEYEKLKDMGYGMNDIVGKNGIEKVMEYELKGEDGYKRVEQDLNGNTLKVLENNPAVPGNNVLLTLDATLQEVAEKSLERTIKEIKENAENRIRKNPNVKYVGEDVAGGAVVAMDVNTGEVLAMASFPTYDPEKFNEDYNHLLKDPLKPMLNRAISGTYSPGSTFKILTSIAGLEEGVVTPEEIIICKGKYRFYEYAGYTPNCWIYSRKYGYSTHSTENITDAIRDSCNYYFYEVGRRLTIENIEKYANKFGLGKETGIELEGENSGILGGPTSREKRNQGPWYPGETLSAAIGEMHAFTPLQLANYVNTVASRGIRYRPHIIKEVKDYNGNTIFEKKPEIIDTLDINDRNIAAVFEGMREVTGENGTASRIFKDFPISVAGKTGTAEMKQSSSNGIFIGFAPFNNPQISVAVVIEHAGSGGNTAPVARDIIASYLNVYKVENNDFPSDKIIP